MAARIISGLLSAACLLLCALMSLSLPEAAARTADTGTPGQVAMAALYMIVLWSALCSIVSAAVALRVPR